MPRRGRGSGDYAKGYPVNYKRHGGPRPLPKEPPPPPTSYDEAGINTRCGVCGDIFNGPRRGENIPASGPDYKAAGDVSDMWACNKRSCIDKRIAETMGAMRQRNPDKDLDYFEEQMREHAYQARREDYDTYPGGFIDDTTPVAPPIDEGLGDE
jgi:hypothetical protein